MIPKVSHGSRPVGLMTYLLGPGRDNEHTLPHVVAGDDRITAGYAGRELTVAGDAGPLGRAVDYARMVQQTQPSDGKTVWHTSLSLARDEGELSDEQWQQVAGRFMQLLGFTAGEHSPVRWAAVRHGRSENGNDHVHLVASRVCDDGSLADWHYDKRRSQQAARQVEREFGLRQLGNGQSRGMPGYTRTELRRVAEQSQPDRIALEPRVRSAAEAAGSEAEFVTNVRAKGLLVRPRYEQGGTSRVVGYSVASAPTQAAREAGESGPTWFGGGRLAPDLTLPNIRARYADTAQERAAAVAVWTRETSHTPVRGRKVPAQRSDWQQVDHELKQLDQWTQQLDRGDVAGWQHAARQVSGGMASLAGRFEPRGTGPITTTARQLARAGQPSPGQSASGGGRPRLPATNALLTHTALGSNSTRGWMAMLQHLERTSQRVARAHALAHSAEHAQNRTSETLERLAEQHHTYEQALTQAGAGQGSRPSRGPGHQRAGPSGRPPRPGGQNPSRGPRR